jgi:hypothetical protein
VNMSLKTNKKQERSPGNGARDTKLASLGFALFVGVALMLILISYYAIRKIDLSELTPALQAINYDRKYIQSNRRVYIYSDGSYDRVTRPPAHPGAPVQSGFPDAPPLPVDLPSSWEVRDALWDDFTHDGIPEFALLVWRPWRDWPFVDESEKPSPIAEAHDSEGDSCHIILIDPSPDITPSNGRTYSEVWAGSALPVPLTKIKAADVNGDGKIELVALEGKYETGRDGEAERVTVWEWVEFGFTLQWSSPACRFAELTLEDINGDGIADIIAD